MSILDRIPRISVARDDTPSSYSAATTFYMILVSAIVLGVFGLLMTFSAAAVSNIALERNPYASFLRSLAIILVSALCAGLASMAPARLWRQLAPYLYLLGVLTQLAVIPFGYSQGGNTNWVRIPGTSQTFQPSELLKLTTCLFLGMVLANIGPEVKNWKRVILAVGTPAILSIGAVMAGHDMGTALVFAAIALGALWVAGAPAKWFAVMGVVAAGAAALLVAVNPSRTRRVLSVLPGFRSAPDPASPTQEAHGLWALGSGGLLGVGPGASREKWDYLQEADTDFILAIVGEEFGLLGTLAVLTALGVLVWGTFRLASHSLTAFARISSGAIGSWLAFQSFVNVGSVTGLLPVIGVPFPLVSHGGSAYLFTALSVGVLLSFARSDAGMTWRTRLDPDTGGRDPRIAQKRRRVKRRRTS